MPEILATEATLSTLKVEIKALTVSGKQMTLAVFRQMPLMNVTQPNGALWANVRYWGIVRYAIKDEGDVWAVIELEGKLYRGRVNHRYSGWYSELGTNDITPQVRVARQQALAAWRAEEAAEEEKKKNKGLPEYPSPWSKAKYDEYTEKRDQWEAQWNERITQLKKLTTKAIDAREQLDEEYAVRHNLSVDALRQLPQLYIAV